ncbi:MAG: hypothetical protein ACYSUT_12470 [Planctomycetota bacterium]
MNRFLPDTSGFGMTGCGIFGLTSLVMPDLIRHPDFDALDPGSGAGVTIEN